jgi:hypothetical protein
MKDKPLFCRLGFHQWYLDSAIFSSVRRCSQCSMVDNESDALKLEIERKIWKEETREDRSYSDTLFAVAKRMFSGTLQPEIEEKCETCGWTIHLTGPNAGICSNCGDRN